MNVTDDFLIGLLYSAPRKGHYQVNYFCVNEICIIINK